MTPIHFYIASDLHYGHRRKGNESTRELADFVIHNPVDGLLIGGDIGANPTSIRECLELFRDFQGFKLVVPGNHDVWLDKDWNTQDSMELHDSILTDVFDQTGFHPLHMEPWSHDDLAFVGSMGWYDYSFRDDIGIPYECYETKTPPWSPMPIWSDARYAKFALDDVSLTNRLNERLQSQLNKVKHAQQIVGLVHHVIDKSLLIHPRSRVPEKWRYANAFLGANCLGQTLASDNRVHQVFCGHIHMERRAQLNHMKCMTIGSDYRKKQLILATPTTVVSQWMFGAEPEGKES